MRTHSSRLASLGAHKIGRVGKLSLTPAIGALLLTAGLSGGQAEAKTPGKTYCFYGKCHRVKTISETEALVGTETTLMASHYDSCKRDRYNPCGLTSSGEAFDSDAPNNAASPIYPDGTTLLVWAPDTKASIVMRVNNAGPYWGNRMLDVSRGAAEVLGFAGQGVAKLMVRVIDAPTVAEATYKKNRTYDPVPGYIGQFASLDEAQTGAVTAYQVAGLVSPFPAAVGAAPIQVAGSTGTQSGATFTPPTVLAAADAVPSDAVEAVAGAATAIAPVKVASLIETAEVSEPKQPKTRDVADAAPKAERRKHVAKSRSHTERVAQRNSRSYRVAAKKQQQRDQARKAIVVAEARAPEGKRIVTRDGTNDMSMFTRHPYAGIDRIAPQNPDRRRSFKTAARYATRDEG
jgi:rare lipoprotein A